MIFSQKMKTPWKSVIATVLCIAILFGAVPRMRYSHVSATSIAEDKAKISQLQDELRVLKNSTSAATEAYTESLRAFQEAQTDYEKAKNAKMALDDQIRALEEEIDMTYQLLQVYTEQKLAYEAAVSEQEEQIASLNQKFISRIRANYEDSFSSYLEVVLSANSFADLLYRVDLIASMLEYDKRIMRQLDAAKTSLTELLTEYKELEATAQETYQTLTEQIPILEERQQQSVTLLLEMEDALEQARLAKDESAEAKATYEAAVYAKQKEMASVQADLDAKIKQAEIAAAQAAAAKKKAEYVGGTLGWPVDLSYSTISSPYTVRSNPLYGYTELHNGIDIPVPYGSNIYAANSGTVIVSEYHYSYGYYVVIDHGGGLSTLYAHNSRLLVSVGDTVQKGQTIAKAGSTGYSTGNHCHFSVRLNSNSVNPLNYVVQP